MISDADRAAFLPIAKLLRAGKHEEALPQLKEMLKRHPSEADLWVLQMQSLLALGRGEVAVQVSEEALALCPSDGGVLNAAGLSYQAIGDYRRAHVLHQAAVTQVPGNPALEVNLGNALRHDGKIADARATYLRAEALQPGGATATLGLAQCAAVEGDAPAAQALLFGVLEKQPLSVEAFYHLVLTLKSATAHKGEAEKKESDLLAQLAPTAAVLEAALARQEIRGERADLLRFALGKLAEVAGDHDRAFALVSMAKMARHHKAQSSGRAVGGDALQAQAQSRLKQIAHWQALPSSGLVDARPLFVLGVPRSGTSLLEKILASALEVTAGGERPDLPRLMKGLLVQGEEVIEFERARQVAVAYLETLDIAHFSTAHLSDKMPENLFYLPFILWAFPAAKVVVITRDPMDCALSNYMTYFTQGLSFADDLDSIAAYLLAADAMVEGVAAAYPGRLVKVTYEDLVLETQSVVGDLFERLGLTRTDAPDTLALSGFSHTASQYQLAGAIGSGSIGRWKAYAKDLKGIEKILAPLSERHRRARRVPD